MEPPSSAGSTYSLSYETGHDVLARLNLAATQATPSSPQTVSSEDVEIAAKAHQQVDTWLDRTKTPQLDRKAGVWGTAEKLPVLANWAMLEYAVDLMEKDLAQLSPSHVRLLWVIQWNLKTLEITSLNGIAKHVLLSRELAHIFWQNPPISFYRKLSKIVAALADYKGEIKENSPFGTIKTYAQDIKNSASFLKIFMPGVITTDPADPAKFPFIDLADLRAHLAANRAVFMVCSNLYLEPVSDTDLRIVYQPEPTWKNAQKVFTEKELPTAQQAQFAANKTHLEPAIQAFLKDYREDIQKFESDFKSFEENSNSQLMKYVIALTPEKQMLISMASTAGGLSMVKEFIAARSDFGTNWSLVLKQICNSQIEHLDLLSSSIKRFESEEPLLSLPRATRARAIRALWEVVESGNLANIAAVMASFLPAKEIDNLLKTDPKFDFIKKLWVMTPEKGFEVLAELYQIYNKEYEDAEEIQFFKRFIPSIDAKELDYFRFFYKTCKAAKLLQPHLGSFPSEVRAPLYMALIASCYNALNLKMVIQMAGPRFFGPEKFQAINKDFENIFPPTEQDEEMLKQGKDVVKIQQLIPSILENLPPHLQSEFSNLINSQSPDFSALDKFCETHGRMVPELNQFFALYKNMQNSLPPEFVEGMQKFAGPGGFGEAMQDLAAQSADPALNEAAAEAMASKDPIRIMELAIKVLKPETLAKLGIKPEMVEAAKAKFAALSPEEKEAVTDQGNAALKSLLPSEKPENPPVD